jgi:AcrR family transcriptional regulator
MARVSGDISEVKARVMQACIALFNEKGLKFTMDDVASTCHISKKTMYVIYRDKEDLFYALVDYLFDGIKESENEVVSDTSLSTLEKIRKILGVMPESYRELDFGKIYLIRDKYPGIYKKVEERLETGWETTIALMEQGIKEGVVRPVNIPMVKMMFEAALEQFFRRDVVSRNNLTYNEALDQVVDIILEGIKA